MEATQKAGFFRRKIEWFDKYADNLADAFGSIFVLSIGSILFAIICYFQNWEWQLPKEYFWHVIIASAAIGLISIVFMFCFAKWSVPRFEKKKKAEPHKGMIYEISQYSIETLTAAGVGVDLTGYLKKRLEEEEEKVPKTLNPPQPDKEKVLKMSIPVKKELGEINWLGELKDNFGKVRVEEFEESLLKYTRRKKTTETVSETSEDSNQNSTET